MKVYFDMEAVQNILWLLHNMSRATATCFDRTLRCRSFIGTEGKLCKKIRSSSHPELRRACHCSDVKHAAHASEKNICYKYTCPAGITEIVVPVRSGKTAIAYYMLGKFIEKARWDEVRRQILRLATRLALDKKDTLDFPNEFPVLDEQAVERALHTLRWSVAASEQDKIISTEKPAALKERGLVRDEAGTAFSLALPPFPEASDSLAARAKKNTTAEKIAELIRENHGADLAISELCKKFSYSKSGLCRLFKRVYRKTLHEYRDEVRLKCARDFLSEGDTAMGDIAKALGFKNAGYFSQWFKTKEGTSPLQYRKKAQEAPPPNEEP